MEININHLRRSVHRLRELLSFNDSGTHHERYYVLNEFINKKAYQSIDVDQLFDYLSDHLQHEAYTIPIANTFAEYLLLLLTKSLRHFSLEKKLNFRDYQIACIALGKLMLISVDAKRFALSFFRDKPAPFESKTLEIHDEPKRFKHDSAKKTQEINQLSLLQCFYRLLLSEPVYFKDLWDWSPIMSKSITENTDKVIQLYVNNIQAILTNMTTQQICELNSDIPIDIQLQFEEQMLSSEEFLQKIPHIEQLQDVPEQIVTLTFNIDTVANIEGVFLPIFNKENSQFYAHTDGSYDKIVKVDSTKVNLRSIALGIASAKAICLSGPVGCGKTTLVEYLARKTGRICPKPKEIEILNSNEYKDYQMLQYMKNRSTYIHPHSVGGKRKSDEEDLETVFNINYFNESSNGFLRIQLGDQTDSKMLLGQYRCTDVPGEFIWLPGVLTEAVMNGYWLLLEDLDSATQDTYTILSSLLERNYLSVPGFRDCVKIVPGFQLFVTVRTNKSTTNYTQKSLYSLLEKYLYTINILPLSRNELCKVVSTNYPKLSTVANRIVDVFLTFSRGDHTSADNLRQQETHDKADNTEKYVALPFDQVATLTTTLPNSGRLVSTRDLIKLCQRSNPLFSVTSTECAYFVFQNAVDVFCSYLPHGKAKTLLITSIGAKLGIIQSRCVHFSNDYKPEVQMDSERIKVGRATLYAKSHVSVPNNCLDRYLEGQPVKRQKLSVKTERPMLSSDFKRLPKGKSTFSFTRLASCILERIAVCVQHEEPVLLVGETGVGKTSSVQYLAERTQHKLVVVNMNNQSDVSDLIGGFKPVELTNIMKPLRNGFEFLFRKTFNAEKNETFLIKFGTAYNQGKHKALLTLMLTICNAVFKKTEDRTLDLLTKWRELQIKLENLKHQLEKSINISFAFIPGSLVRCIKKGEWVLLDEINLASAETLECLSTILEPDGSVVLLERGDFTPIKRHTDFRIFACMNPNTDIGKKDLSVGIRNRFTEFFVDELTTDTDLNLLVSDYLSDTGIQKKCVHNIVKLYKRLKALSELELNDGLGNRPVYSLRTLCRSLRICAKNLCGSIERNLYESFCLSFLTQLDPASHAIVLLLIKDALLSNPNAALKQALPKLGDNFLNFEGYWVQQGPKEVDECSSYILTDSVKNNLKDLARIISIGKLPILLQGPTSAGKTSLIDYVAKRSGNHCLRINNHEHTDLQEYIGTYAADVTGKLTFREGMLVQAMRHGYWIILDELNLASTDILEALNRVLDDNRELFIPETQTVVKAHPNFMLFATQNPPGLYGGRKTLSRAFKNRFIELHFADIPRQELEIILEKRCQIPASYAKKMVLCMGDLQKNRKTTTKNVFTLRDLFRWGNRYTYADRTLLDDPKYDWNQHLIEEGYLVLSAKVRTTTEIEIIDEALYRNFKKRVNLELLFDVQTHMPSSPVTKKIIDAIKEFKQRTDIVWTRNMTRMAVLTAKALQFDEPVLLVGPTGCGKTTVCQLLATINGVQLRILNCHMHTEGADFLGGLRPCRNQQTNSNESRKLFEWSDGPLVYAMQEGSYFMADEISLAEDSVLERLNCVLEPERTLLLAEKGGVTDVEMSEFSKEFVVRAKAGFQFLATMNPGGDFGKKELSPALRNRFSEVWCLPSEDKADLVEIAYNCMISRNETIQNPEYTRKIASYLVEIVLFIRHTNDKFKFSIRDILAWANYLASNKHLSFPEQAIFGLETIFLDAFEMLPHESQAQIESLKNLIKNCAVAKAADILNTNFTLNQIENERGQDVILTENKFGIKPFFISTNPNREIQANASFFFDAPTTKRNLFRLLSALSLQKPVLLEGPPGVGKTSIVESIAHAIGYQIVRINLCEHTDLADLFGTDLPAEDNALNAESTNTSQPKDHKQIGSFVWRDGPLLAALKSENTWILLDELNLAPQSVLEGLNAILDHRGEVYIPELNKSFLLDKQTRIFACQNPLKQGGGRKGLPQSFLNRFNKVYLRKLTTEDLLHVVNIKYANYFNQLQVYFQQILTKSTYEQNNIFEIHAGNKVLSTTECLQQSVPHKKLDFDLAERLVRFSEVLDHGISNMEFGYKGGPYEFNLRDILRWCDLLHNPETGFLFQPCTPNTENFNKNFSDFLLTLYERMKLVYYQRMRSEHDKLFIQNAFSSVFQCDADQLNTLSEDVALYWTNDKIYLNDIVLKRSGAQPNGAILPAQKAELSPLLLSSQLEIFKQIVESVHMEKPILLCGPTDAGKTKLIDALCQLSNQICNTDTIDDSVTGSFQQIDLNRHLEEIANNIESILVSTTRQTILQKGKSNIIGNLFRIWSKYTVLSNTRIEFQNNASVGEEYRFFLNRITSLNDVIDVLKDLPQENQTIPNFHKFISHQSLLLSILKNHVTNAKSLNTGGSFEWVDSKIVKSLKCGQYILLEHVNLCSSAVLDRLNSVFEPNGKLLISEKGVSASETAEIVEKAPNFRAFLTIDPKNGELSRAMRNRCVELALTKDSYDMDDMRAIVHSQGVHEIRAIDCILQIHGNICTLTEINSYTISHLTQFAFLTNSYNRIGYKIPRAIYVSAMEVYVYAANTDLMGYGLAFYQNKLRDVVLSETENLVIDQTKQCEDHLSSVILRCSDLNTSAMIKMQMAPLKVLLKSDELQQDQLAALFKKFEHLNFSSLSATELKAYFVYILYEVSSIDDIHIRHRYIDGLLQRQTTTAQLNALASRLYKCIQEHESNLNVSLKSLPWNRKLYPRIRDYNIQKIDDCRQLSLSASLLAELLVDEIPNHTLGKLQQIDALTYSQAVVTKNITDKFNNKFLNNLSNFLAHLQAILKKSLSLANMSLEQYAVIVTSYLWFNRLVKISQQKLFKNKQLNTDLLDKIILHFKWLEKHLLKLLAELLPLQICVNSEYDRSLQKLGDYVVSVKHPLNLIRKMYAKNLTQFQPFYQEEQVEIFELTHDMDQLLGVVPAYGSYTKEQLMKKFNAQKLDTVKQLRVLLNEDQCTAFNYQFKEPSHKSTNISNIASEVIELLAKTHELDVGNEQQQPIDLIAIKTQLEQLDELVNSQDELKVNQQPNDLELSLQALREYYLDKLLVQSLNKNIETPADINTLYCEELHTLSNETWKLIAELNNSRHKNLATAWSKLVRHISNIKSQDEFDELIQCLNVSYKNITTYQRLINKAVIRNQLENLAVRSQSVNILYTSESEINSNYQYEGPSMVNVITSLIFQENGQLKPVPLHELGNWRKILLDMRQLLWHNSNLMVPAFRVQINNMHYTVQNAKRLIYEVAYVQQLSASNDSDTTDKCGEYNAGFRQLTQSLQESYRQLQSPDTTNNTYQELQYQTGLTNTLIGALELCLLTFTPLIDPVEKNRLKNDFIAEDINCLNHLITAYDFMKIIMRYQHFGNDIYGSLKQRLHISLEKQQKLSQKLALRPVECLYSSLVQDITHFMKTNCEPQVFYKLITAIEDMWIKLTKNKSINEEEIKCCTETLNKIENWLASSQRFVNHILKRYMDYYQDFLQPIQCAVMQTRFGLENLKVVFSQLKSAGNLKKASKVQSLLTNIIEFPTAKQLCIFNPEVYSLVEPLPHSEHEYFKLLKVKLSDIHNRIMLASSINETNFKEFDFALKVCNQTWQKEEDRRRKQKAEAESLYVTKTRCATEDEELMELQEIEEIFPTNVDEDFGEFMVEPTLEKVMKLDKQDDLKAKLAQIVRDEDYGFLAENFMNVMIKYSQIYYHQEKSKQQIGVDIIEAFQMRLGVFVKLYAHYKECLNECMDESTYNTLSFAVGLQQQLLNDISFSQQRLKAYNYYKHSNIPEIISCNDVLNRIEIKVEHQLDLYPEHAGLIDIKLVIERIRKLPSTATVVRFNTGFQLLRQKLSLWNKVAHKLNHLRDEEIEVAEYVQRWTKLELQHWRNCLTQTYESVEAHAYRYWFFIYNLLQQFIGQQKVQNTYIEMKYVEKRFANEELLDETDVNAEVDLEAADVIRILRQFVEVACYGDFHVRLQLLRAFEMYLQNMAKYSQHNFDSLIAGLHNLQIYFAQFAAEIKETNQSRRAPIEKKLKEFVKIESYNKDLSYFSMRNNVARVHRNLNKFLKEYRLLLQEKITPVFQPQDATVKDYNFANDKGRDLRYDTRIKYYMPDTKCFVASEKLREKYVPRHLEELLSHDDNTTLQKIGKHFITARNVVKETVTHANYPNLIIAIDLLLVEQLERCEHLRNLNVDRSKERPKQILEAKQILQQKRKALTDLFKTLTQLGANYKTGLLESSLCTDLANFSLPPFCIKTMLGNIKEKHISSNLVRLSENMDLYYAKSVFKLKLLQNIMLTPLSELGPPNIERIKGFAIDMFLLVQNQRELLSNATKQIYDLHVNLQNLREVAQIISADEVVQPNLLDFNKTNTVYNALKVSLCQIHYVFKQFEILLVCAPTQENKEHVLLHESENRLCQGSTYYNAIVEACDNILKQSKSTLLDMEKQNDEFLDVEKVHVYRQAHDNIIGELKTVLRILQAPTNNTEHLPSAQPLLELLAFVEETTGDATLNRSHDELPNDFDNIDAELSNVLHTVLLSLQKLYKRHPKPSPPSVTNSPSQKSRSPEGEDSAYELQEQHLKQGLFKELDTDWQLLSMPRMNTKLDNILLSLKLGESTEEKLNCARKVTTLIPILEQYYLLADYYLLQQLGAHKVSAKMLSVMLTVFVEISTKGFCVPKDLMQDEEGQTKSDQNKGEGFGLEDGTGENDASDKIESEDQLDDAKRPEDRKDDDKKQDQDDCKQEKGIDMSDDFDGKMQDIEKPENEEDDSGESENEEEPNKEMGDTEEGADKLDDQIWGDDEEEDKEEQEEPELNEEDEGKGSKDEKDSHNDLDTKNETAKEDGTDEHEKDGLDATNEPNNQEDKRKQQEKDIDNMKEPEVDEDQPNPYHNELEEPPEPEDMELGDMNNEDEGNDNDDEQNGDENPFDLDKMKENMQPPEQEDAEEGDELEDKDDSYENNGESDDSDSEAEDTGKERPDDKDAENSEEQKEDAEEQKDEESLTQTRGELENEPEADEEKEEKEENAEKPEEKPEQHSQSNDKSSKEENVQSVPETEQNSSADQVQNQDDNVKQDQKMDEQETGEEKDGIGQAENETNDGGHQGIAETKETISQEERKNERQTQEKRKQGHTNEERTLGEAQQNKLKQLKTIEKMQEQQQDGTEENDSTEKEAETEEYQHVKEPKNSDKTTLDNATEEQSKKIQHLEDESKAEDDSDSAENAEELMEVDEQTESKDNEEQLEQLSAEKHEHSKSDKPAKPEQNTERLETAEEMEVEGDIVPTMTVPRSTDTTAHCNNEVLLDKSSMGQELSVIEQIELRKSYQEQLTKSNSTLPQHEAYETWQIIANRMTQNARELCEQLRLILEPTKCTRLKGDYRTGRRINMKKIIPYIASQFRKDKIWLRRTKPAQRDYKITIAIDDSKSMHHNNSKTLTLEAISLVSQALTFLESGRLSIVSFGETPRIILNHTEQFDGPKLVSSLNFAQDKTKIAGLLDFIRIVNTEEGALGGDNGLFENLLLVLSDGRNIFSEGKMKVNNAIKLARLQRIFLVYVIIDNPDNKNSILDVQHMEFGPNKSITMKSYMDVFPFPYYVIVRDLNQLPLVLSEAMRQWFELVSSEQ